MTLENGMHRDIPEPEYFAIEAVSASMLARIFEDAEVWKYEQDHPEARKESDAMLIGSAVHDLVLRPELFGDLWVESPTENRRPKMYREAVELAAKVGARVLLPKDMATVREMAAVVTAEPEVQAVLDGADTELTLIFDAPPPFTFKCKARVDIWHPTLNALIDLKTTIDPRQGDRHFGKQARNLHYDLKMAWYKDAFVRLGMDAPERVGAIALSNKPPYRVGLFRLEEESCLERGRLDYRNALEKYARCKQLNHWRETPHRWVELEMPGW